MDNNNMVLIIAAAVVVIFVLIASFVIYTRIKRRNASWTGTVIDKNMSETASAPMNMNNNMNSGITFGNRSAVNTSYTLRIKSGDRKEFAWPVGEGFYNATAVGDKLQKSPGTETPVKL